MSDFNPDCYTQEQILFTAAAKALTTANYFPTTGIMKGLMAKSVLIGLESNDIRYHIRETKVTAATNCGMILVAGDYLQLGSPAMIQCFNGINTGGSSSTATIFYCA